mmetsp:Transcript_39241/g.37655  ORF Transcript_39241/g.37655 Transcript_39241/m.37655 type:complete len:91 (-) Transcript_39241:47-319(-)
MKPVIEPIIGPVTKYILLNVFARTYLSYIMSAYFLYLHDDSIAMRKAFHFIPDLILVGSVIFLTITGLPGIIHKKYGPVKTETPAEVKKN